MEYGANLVEINPLVLTKDGSVIASDAKVDLDDNGLFRHPWLQEWHAMMPADEDQAAALATGLGRSNYAKLTGTVGVIANGAGLGMGTMDAIRNAGGDAANFLDIGGGAQAELVRKSYALVVGDPAVKSLFINIFGGITRGDAVANGIVEALKGGDLRKVPMVVRLTGTEREGRPSHPRGRRDESGGDDGRRGPGCSRIGGPWLRAAVAEGGAAGAACRFGDAPIAHRVKLGARSSSLPPSGPPLLLDAPQRHAAPRRPALNHSWVVRVESRRRNP